MIALDMVKEYTLIGYMKLLPYILRELPRKWAYGDKGTIVLIPGFHETYFFFL